jgi:hypothetical protein
MPTPPTSAQFAQMRAAVKAILELPRDGIGAIVLVPFAVEGGADTGLKILTMGLESDFVAEILRKAIRVVENEQPHASGPMDQSKD